MPDQVNSTISRLKEFSPLTSIGSFVLAASIAYSGWIGHSAVNAQQVQSNTKTIESLQTQVRGLQLEIEHSKVIEQRLDDVKEQSAETQQSVNRLAEELHSWQREERAFHRTK